MAVNNRGYRGLEYDLGFCGRMNRTLFDSLMITDHSLHAMALNSIEIRGQQNVLDDFPLFLGKSEVVKNIGAETIQCFI